MERTRRYSDRSPNIRASGRVRRRTVAGLLASVMVATLVGPAMATHDEDCIDYSHPESPVDEIALEAVVIAAELAAGIAHDYAEHWEELAEKTPPPAQQALETKERISRIVTGIAMTVQYGTSIALLVIQSINNQADECRGDAHWRTTDELLASAIRRDLALTSTPVAMFVLPEEHGGYIDAEGVGVKVIVRDAIDRMVSARQCTCTTAENTYKAAVDELDKESPNYKYAYKLFRQAYVYAFSN